ncbi:MAG: ATP-binding cassette domain-containing protein [Lactobacillus sp.]
MLLELKNVSLTIDDKPIINNLSLKIKQNDYLTITGPSGSGKSTTLKLIADLISPTSGNIYFNDKDINEYRPTEYRKQVSYCFQQPVLFGKTVKDNLEFPFSIRNLPFDQEKAINALKNVLLDSSYLNKNITELSGGEKQRIALIRNVLFKPKVLLLDEITTGLDEKSKNIVHDFINDIYSQGTTIIQVTHDSEELNSARHTIIISKGAFEDEKFSR